MNEEEQKPHPLEDVGVIRPQQNSKPQSVLLEEALAKEKEKERQAPMRPLKTYQSDVAEAIKKDNISVIKMALAEKRRQDKEAVKQEIFPTESKKGVSLFALSILLIMLGLGILSYFIFYHKNEVGTFAVDSFRNIVFVEKNDEIKLDNDNPKKIVEAISKLKETPLPKGSMENLTVMKKNISSSTLLTSRALSAGEFINVFRTRIPAAFFRSIKNPFMLGLYSGNATTETFMILKTDSYENAFAGMLDWEQNFQLDIGDLFSIPHNLRETPPEIKIATSSTSTTASSTASTSAVTLVPSTNFSFLPKPFEDRVVNNRDVRVLTDQSGNIVFLYSFIDSNTLVFTSGRESFVEIMSRYLQTKKEK